MKVQDARAMALEAAARGWLGLDGVWETARRMAARPLLGAEQVFDGLLSPEQVTRLSREFRSDAETWDQPVPTTQPTRDAYELTGSPITDRPSDEPPPALDALPGRLSGPRYVLVEQLGQGGAGEVLAALDREIGRTVALKTLRTRRDDPRLVRRFVYEARITGQLEHPSIVPVYDLGALPDGRPYYTMRVVKRQSLRDVLASAELRAHWPLVRLLGAFVQLARGLAYAHSRGVIHGDIKPENILLGDFGEVYLADWGLAKVQRGSSLQLSATGSAPPPDRALPGGGTPGYLAPELVISDWSATTYASDLFALGVVLYELLTGEHPFVRDDPRAMLFAPLHTDPKRPREVAPGCPLLLEDLCLALLAREPTRRPRSADEVAAQVEAFLEGAKEKERRRDEARRLCEQARAPIERYHQLEAEQQRLAALARRALKDVLGWEPIERKHAGWSLEDRAAEAERESARTLAEAIELYIKALGYDAECADAHRGLAELYWGRAQAAERQRRETAQIHYEALVAEHDVTGRFTSLMRATAQLSLRSDPAGARVVAQPYEERDRVLRAGEERFLGYTPLHRAELPAGSWLVTLELDGFRKVRYPILLARGAHLESDVNLYTDAEIGEGFVFVPGGPVTLGDDPDAIAPIPRQAVWVPDFAIARHPVTMREYCAFLDALDASGEHALAEQRAPHDLRGSEGLVVHRDSSGRWTPNEQIIEGEARKLFPLEQGHLWRVPVHLTDWFDARAYCRWRSEQARTELRLASEAEWEKAARGTDGRFFPRGNRFDPTFCHMRESRAFAGQPEPVGSFPWDESPYGACDMAGGMREWVGDVFGEKTCAELMREPEPPPDAPRGESGWRMARSGGWITDRTWTRAASRGGLWAHQRGMALTFRIATTLPRARPAPPSVRPPAR